MELQRHRVSDKTKSHSLRDLFHMNSFFILFSYETEIRATLNGVVMG